MKLSTVKIKTEDEAGFAIINASDLTRDHVIFGEEENAEEAAPEEEKTAVRRRVSK
jgi:hypothetical protein